MWSADCSYFVSFSQVSNSKQAKLTNSIDQVEEHYESIEQKRQCPGAQDTHESVVERSQSLQSTSLLYCEKTSLLYCGGTTHLRMQLWQQ